MRRQKSAKSVSGLMKTTYTWLYSVDLAGKSLHSGHGDLGIPPDSNFQQSYLLHTAIQHLRGRKKGLQFSSLSLD